MGDDGGEPVAVVDAELLAGVPQARLHRPDRQDEVFGDLPVLEPAGGERRGRQALWLLRGKPLDLVGWDSALSTSPR